MAGLREFYDTRVSMAGDDGFLKQVGHTEKGAPISPDQFDKMVGQLEQLLDLNGGDRLLDLACGNGMVTARLGRSAGSTVGVDLSPELVRVARTHHGGPSITYNCGDLRDLSDMTELSDAPFSKVLMHAALQHFSPDDFETLLVSLLKLAEPDAVFVFGFIPEDGKQKHLFYSVSRRLNRLWLRATGRDHFGHWWCKSELEDICGRLGLDCTFYPVDSSLAASSYRFNMRIRAATGGQSGNG